MSGTGTRWLRPGGESTGGTSPTRRQVPGLKACSNKQAVEALGRRDGEVCVNRDGNAAKNILRLGLWHDRSWRLDTLLILFLFTRVEG